jgi:hypothetical protein
MAQVCKIASECGIDQHELPSAIKFLVKIGSLVHFADQQPTRATSTTTEQPPTTTSTTKLAEYVFCSAQWLVDVLKCLITDNHRLRGVYQTKLASQQPMLWSPHTLLIEPIVIDCLLHQCGCRNARIRVDDTVWPVQPASD